MSDHVTFSTIDWIIVFAYLAGSVVIGLLVKRYIASMTDYYAQRKYLELKL